MCDQAPVNAKKASVAVLSLDVTPFQNPAKCSDIASPVLNRPVQECRSQLLIREIRFLADGIQYVRAKLTRT